MTQWGPEHDEPIPYRPTTDMVLARDGHVHVIDPRYITAGLREAAQWCADAVEEMSADWIDIYLNNPEARAQMDELSLDDHGHWQCPAGTDHDWDDTCDCTPEER